MVRKLICLFVFFITSESAFTQEIIVESGEVLTRQDIESGVFMGQIFTLGPSTVFSIRDGGTIGPLPDINFKSIDFNGASVVMEVGSVFASGIDADRSAVGNVHIEVQGGGLIESLIIHSESTLVIDGGVIAGSLTTYATQVRLISGSIGGISAGTNTQFEMEGGEILGGILASGNASILIHEGDIGGGLRMFGASSFLFSKGRIAGGLEILSEDCLGIWSGGVFGESFELAQGARVTILGGEFEMNGVPGDTFTGVVADDQILTGVLSDGTPFILAAEVGDFAESESVTLIEVPVPFVDLTPIIVDSDEAPTGLRAGQLLTILEGGSLPQDFAAVNATIVMDGGMIGRRFECVSTHLTINGGAVDFTSSTLQGSTVDFNAGTIEGFFTVGTGSVLNLDGGNVTYNLDIRDGAVVNLNAGDIGDNVSVWSGGLLNISGGTRGGFLVVDSKGTLNLNVVDLAIDGVDVDLVDGMTMVIPQRGGELLQATLLDASIIEFALSESFNFDTWFFPGAVLTVSSGIACPADLTGDGAVNFFDVSAFLQAFAAKDPIADFDDNGIFNFFDVSEFLQAFAAGCP